MAQYIGELPLCQPYLYYDMTSWVLWYHSHVVWFCMLLLFHDVNEHPVTICHCCLALSLYHLPFQRLNLKWPHSMAWSIQTHWFYWATVEHWLVVHWGNETTLAYWLKDIVTHLLRYGTSCKVNLADAYMWRSVGMVVCWYGCTCYMFTWPVNKECPSCVDFSHIVRLILSLGCIRLTNYC